MTRVNKRRIVLVTGAPRSATTAVGDILALAPGARSLHEPMNALVGVRAVGRYFETVGAGGFDARDLACLVAGIGRLDMPYRPGVFPRDRGLRRLAKRMVGGRARLSRLACKLDPALRTIVWKDPFAALVAGDVAATHGIPVVVTVRHPWAVAGSFRRLGWGFEVADLDRRARSAELPGLPDGMAEQFDWRDPVANAAAVWRICYANLLAAARRTPDLITLLDMDAVIAGPVDAYRALYARVGLQWTPSVASGVHRRYAPPRDARPAPRADVPFDRRLDPLAANSYWRGFLSETEAATVDGIAGDVWREMRQAMRSHAHARGAA